MSKRSESVDNREKAAEAEPHAGPESAKIEAGQEGGSDVGKLRTQLTEKDKEIAELKDKYLRTLADFENARKRLRQQGEEAVRLQRENLLRGILPVVDNLERAVAAAKGGGNGQSIVAGVEMV